MDYKTIYGFPLSTCVHSYHCIWKHVRELSSAWFWCVDLVKILQNWKWWVRRHKFHSLLVKRRRKIMWICATELTLNYGLNKLWWISRRISQVYLITFSQLYWLPSVSLHYLPSKRIFIATHLVPFPLVPSPSAHMIQQEASHGVIELELMEYDLEKNAAYFQHWNILAICFDWYWT